MSRIRKLGLASLIVLGTATHATAHSNIAYAFAACAGRFSAEMEHAWLMNDPVADEVANARSAFVVLTDAAIPAGQGRQVLNHRVDAKLAHAALLQQASFSTRPAQARTARSTANGHLATCQSLLLGS